MGIGTRIKKLRKQAGLTQPELADKLGVHETTIRRWEKETDSGPDSKTVTLLADVLATTPEYLLTDVEDYSSNNTAIDEEKTLIYEWGGNHRLQLPNTPETRKMFEQIVFRSMGNAVPSGA